MLPTPSDVHVNTPLSNISVAFLQDANNFVAGRVFQNIPVQKQSDVYYTYDRGMFNRDQMQRRAPGTESAGGGWTVDATPTYYCATWALHKDVPDEVRANADGPLNMDRDATLWLSTQAMIRKEKLFTANYFTTGVWTYGAHGVAASPGTGDVLKWSDANSTPIEDVRRARRTVQESTGFRPNIMTTSRTVYDALVDHPDMIDRIKYGQTAGGPARTTQQALAALFEVDEILISEAIENTAQEGQTNTHSFIAGKHALLSYRPPSPGLMTPAAGYTFSWNGFMGASALGSRIMSFRMQNLKSDRIEIEMCFDQKVVSADLGYFFDAIVA